MNDSFKKVLDLVRRTGDRMVVTDPEGNHAFVVMDLDQYEVFVDLEEAFLNGLPVGEGIKLEDDESSLEETEPSQSGQFDIQPATPTGETDEPPTVWSHMQGANDSGETWDLHQLSDEEMSGLEEEFKAWKRAKKGQNSEETTESEDPAVPESEQQTDEVTDEVGGEVSGSINEEDEFGEEQFYLEPIE